MSEHTQEERGLYARSPLTGNWYLVTEWEDRGEGKIVAHDKTQVDVDKVPDEAKKSVNEREKDWWTAEKA